MAPSGFSLRLGTLALRRVHRPERRYRGTSALHLRHRVHSPERRHYDTFALRRRCILAMDCRRLDADSKEGTDCRDGRDKFDRLLDRFDRLLDRFDRLSDGVSVGWLHGSRRPS